MGKWGGALHHYGRAAGRRGAEAIGERAVVVEPAFRDQREGISHRHPFGWRAMDTAVYQHVRHKHRINDRINDRVVDAAGSLSGGQLV